MAEAKNGLKYYNNMLGNIEKVLHKNNAIMINLVNYQKLLNKAHDQVILEQANVNDLNNKM